MRRFIELRREPLASFRLDANGILRLEAKRTNTTNALVTSSAMSGGVAAPSYLPSNAILGQRLAIMGDSRSDNGVISQSTLLTTSGMTTGVPEGNRLHGVPLWLMHALGWPMETAGQWTFGGGKTSQYCHGQALAVVAARRPSAVIYLGTTNDPVDYSGGGGLVPILLGDPDADPATLPRVGDRAPVGTGIGQQGTTLGNLDKMIRFFGALNVPVIAYEIPTESLSRRQRNRDVHQWLQARKAAGTYPNLIAPNVYTPLLTDPAMIDGPIASETVRTDLDATVGLMKSDAPESAWLHPSPSGARFIGETMATDASVIAAFAGLDPLITLPDGTNDADFLNPNPTIAVGAGNGVLGYSGSASPAPTGTVAEDWELGHNVSTGSIGVVASFDGGDQVVTITRTGGSSATTAINVELRQTAIPITPVAGDVYVLDGEVEVPGRDPQDLFAVYAHLQFSETGLVDDYGQAINAGTYGSFASNSPQHFPKNGDALQVHGVPLEITPAMVASATGAIDISARCQISFADNMDTAANGPLVVKIKSMGIRKLELAEPHITAPAVPAAGPTCSVAPSISGSLFVGYDITLNDGTFASGSITGRRLLRNGVSVSFTGTTYALTEADLGATFVFENTATSGGTTTAMSAVTLAVENPSAELVALKDALDGDENNAIYDFTSASAIGNNYSCPDLSGNGNPAAQGFLVRHPGIDATLGATMDGSNDCMGFTWQTAAPSTVSVVFTARKDVGATAKRLLSDGVGTTNQSGFYQVAVNALNGTWTVDGASVSTQGDLYTALNDGLEHTLIVTGLSMSGWPSIFFGRSSASHQGSIRRGVMIDEATPDLAATRTLAVSFVEAS